MSRDQVKFVDKDGKVYFGSVVSPTYNEEAKKLAEKGVALIKDAVTPQHYQFPEKLLVDIPYGPWTRDVAARNDPTKFWGRDDEFCRYQHAEYVKAHELNEKAAGKPVVGAMFSISIADGKAIYVITAVKGKRCLVEHRQFVGDDYYDHHFGIGGWFTIKSVEPYVAREYGLRQLFKKK